MIKNKAKTLTVLFIFAVALLFNAFSYAASDETKIVLAVEVKGNKVVSTPTVLAKIKIKPGMNFAQEVINDDIKRLYALGYFTDVAVDVDEEPGGVTVTIMVEEKPVVKEIAFEGNKKMTSRRLKKVIQSKDGDMLKLSKLSEDVAEIKSLYATNGFHDTTVKYELEKDEELNQVTVKIVVNESARIRIKKVTIEGNHAVKTGKITELMQTRPAWIFRRGYFDEETFEDDLNRIKMYYHDQGYLDVAITPQFDYDEGKGVMLITLKIEEGNIYRISEVVIKGNIIFPEAEIMEKISTMTGDPFSFTKLRSDMESLRGVYYNRGYMNVVISIDRTIKAKTHELDIIFNIDGKNVVYIGKVDVKGNTKTKDIVIRRELRAYPGERFDGEKIRRSKERLYNLGFFEDIYFETKPTTEPNVSDLEIAVKETKTGEFSFGGGYSSVDEFIGFAQVTQKNFDIFNFPYFTGDGQNLSIRAELGTARNNYNISWTEPWIFDYPLSFGFDIYHMTHMRRTHVGYGYEEVRAGGDVRFGKEFMEYFRSDLVYKLESVEISDISDDATQDIKDEEGDNWLSTVLMAVQFDNRDNVYSPKKGFVSSASIENAGGFLGGDKDFIKGFLSNKFYYSPPLQPFDKLVLEIKGRAGAVTEYANTDKVPIYERFYAGGANTIRGYRERRVGPRDTASNDPIGGEATLIGNMEITFPLYEKIIKGALFYDVGNVWAELADMGQGGYKHGIGAGVRVKTPIGPLKLDWGYPLTDNQDDEKNGEFYFSVSHGF